MTDLNLEELERICNAATPGEWDVDEGNLAVYSWPSDGDVVTIFLPDTSFANDPYVAPHNARFAAVAHSAMPQLIAEVRRLQKEVSSLKKRERVAMCIWCGSRIAAYTGHPSDMSNEEIDALIQKCREHDLNCPKNPTTQRSIHAEKKARVLAEAFSYSAQCHRCLAQPTCGKYGHHANTTTQTCSGSVSAWAEAKAKEPQNAE